MGGRRNIPPNLPPAMMQRASIMADDDIPPDQIEGVRQFLELLGEDPKRGGLIETPKRFLKAWKFWTSGYGQDPNAVLKQFEDGADKCDEMVFQARVPFYSQCEHHLAPFFGYAHIGYIPNGRIVGLSKLSRLLDIFARRLQVQERLTNQMVESLMKHLGAHGAGVVIQARHLCMESRGIQKTGTVTVTSAVRGNFKDKPEVRAEFMAFVQTAMGGVQAL